MRWKSSSGISCRTPSKEHSREHLPFEVRMFSILPQRAVPQLFLVIVHQMNDGIALGELPSFQPGFRGGDHGVQRRIDVPDPACPSLGPAEDLGIITSV